MVDYIEYLVFLGDQGQAVSKPLLVEVPPNSAYGHIIATKEQILKIVSNSDEVKFEV